jgi:hypothetical protein
MVHAGEALAKRKLAQAVITERVHGLAATPRRNIQ